MPTPGLGSGGDCAVGWGPQSSCGLLLEALPSFLRFSAKGTSIGVRERQAVWEGGEDVSGGPLDCEYTPSTNPRHNRLRAHYDSVQFGQHTPERTDCLPYVYLRLHVGSVLPSSRKVVEGTTMTQPTSHRVAYSRSDASSAEEQG